MQHSAHRVYIGFLLGIAVITTIAGGLYGAEYYLTPLADRPFHPQYDELKPTGAVGHGYGIVGSLMIIAGVSMYSSRKRLRLLSGMGKLPLFLEFHIFLCLTGPILVLYHTTFKFGGLVAVSFWSMTAIVLSGVVGRYLYVQIPRGIHGHELNAAELAREQSRLTSSLIDEFGLRPDMIARVDRLSGTSGQRVQRGGQVGGTERLLGGPGPPLPPDRQRGGLRQARPSAAQAARRACPLGSSCVLLPAPAGLSRPRYSSPRAAP